MVIVPIPPQLFEAAFRVPDRKPDDANKFLTSFFWAIIGTESWIAMNERSIAASLASEFTQSAYDFYIETPDVIDTPEYNRLVEAFTEFSSYISPWTWAGVRRHILDHLERYDVVGENTNLDLEINFTNRTFIIYTND